MEENHNPGHQFVGGVLSKNRNKEKRDTAPDEVVKTLDDFIRETEISVSKFIKVHPDYASGFDKPFIYFQATQKYKTYLLGLKDKQIKKLEANISEQQKEIERQKVIYKRACAVLERSANLHAKVDEVVVKQASELIKLTQENEALKQK